MNWKFQVGKQVVCIRDDWWKVDINCVYYPIIGEILTIRNVQMVQDFSYGQEPVLALRFEEIINPLVNTRYGITETWYLAEHFRPVKETSIECFKKLLITPPLKENVL